MSNAKLTPIAASLIERLAARKLNNEQRNALILAYLDLKLEFFMTPRMTEQQKHAQRLPYLSELVRHHVFERHGNNKQMREGAISQAYFQGYQGIPRLCRKANQGAKEYIDSHELTHTTADHGLVYRVVFDPYYKAYHRVCTFKQHYGQMVGHPENWSPKGTGWNHSFGEPHIYRVVDWAVRGDRQVFKLPVHWLSQLHSDDDDGDDSD